MDGQKYYLSYYTPSDLGLGEYDNTHYTSDLWGYYLYSSTSLDKVDLPVISREFVDDSFVFLNPFLEQACTMMSSRNYPGLFQM